MTKLTTRDLEAALQDDRHQGYGYAESQSLPTSTRARLDRLVVAEANVLGWTAEDLFHWTNSKFGRWLSDEFHGPRLNAEAARHVVRAYVNETARRQSQEF